MTSAIPLLLVLASMSLCACSGRFIGEDARRTQAADHQELDKLPPSAKEALAPQSENDRQAFLARPVAERDAVAVEWQRREKLLDRFTPTEKTIISTLSQQDSEAFFKIPNDEKDQEERFLSDVVTIYFESLDVCLFNTHRSFGPPAEPKAPPRSLGHFTPAEQAVIMRLSEAESKQFFSLSADQQEAVLSSTVYRTVEQILACSTHSNRRVGERG